MIFISYSRRDYYFAESLAFQLIKHDIDVWLDSKDLEPCTDWSEAIDSAIDAASCLILVVSPDSWKSTIVRREWQRSRSQGKRIIVVLFRTKTIPQELESAEIIDFRGAFEPALKQLVYHLTSSNTNLTVSSHHLGLAFRWPPAVVTIVLLLACAFLIPLLLNPYVYKVGLITSRSFLITKLIVIGGRFDPSFYTVYIITVFLLLAVLYVRVAFLDFVRRRMGMTQLALVFAFGVYFWGAPLLQHLFGQFLPHWVPAILMRLLRNNWPISVMLFSAGCAASLAGLWIVLFQRPGDLLRWMPTGYAWHSYRVKQAPKVVVAKDAFFSLKKLKRFKLLYESQDALLAERLRQKLCSAGAIHAPDDSEDSTSILLLTNCTHVDWIEQQAQRLRGRFLPFLG
ncbi:MAG: toll/interleukin-1 receptor domain-containing protein, partial [Candidatus Methylumidiphilus sp.]